MVARLKDPAVRAKVIAAMREPHPKDWESLYQQSRADGNADTRHAQRAAQAAHRPDGCRDRPAARRESGGCDHRSRDRGQRRAGAAYTIINEENIKKQIVLPWVSLGSDARVECPGGVFLESSDASAAYGNFARLFAKYVREDHLMTVQEAVRKVTSLPADVLSLPDRGRLKAGAFADVVLFRPGRPSRTTRPMRSRCSTRAGVTEVFINGQLALKDGEPTGAHTGRTLRGRAWVGAGGGRLPRHEQGLDLDRSAAAAGA